MKRAWIERLRVLLSHARGQAVLEHALVTFLILGSGTVVLTQFLPGMVNALNDYLHGYYFVLQLPLP